MKISAVTRRGIGKPASDDRILVGSRVLCEEEFTAELPALCPVGIADGVGGYAGGDIAAQYVCERLSQCVPELDAVTALNDSIIAISRKTTGKEKMASTFSGIIPVTEGVVRLLHIGNTRVYAIQGGYLKQLTTDMTAYNYFMSLGRTEDAENCSRSEITACFGGGTRSLFKPLLTEIQPCSALITSDGVHDFVDIDALEQLISEAGSDIDACRRIVAASLECGSEDDISVLIARI